MVYHGASVLIANGRTTMRTAVGMFKILIGALVSAGWEVKVEVNESALEGKYNVYNSRYMEAYPHKGDKEFYIAVVRQETCEKDYSLILLVNDCAKCTAGSSAEITYQIMPTDIWLPNVLSNESFEGTVCGITAHPGMKNIPDLVFEAVRYESDVVVLRED